jgi:hypothetical protein
MRRLEEVRMVLGPRKATSLISNLSFIKRPNIDYGLIKERETSTASLHDAQVDLSIEGEVVLREIRGHKSRKQRQKTAETSATSWSRPQRRF